MALSANRKGRSLPGGQCDICATRRGQSAVPRKNLARSLSPGGGPGREAKETALCGVDIDTDREERVHEMQPSVLVNAYEGEVLQAGYRHLPQRKIREEGVQPPGPCNPPKCAPSRPCGRSGNALQGLPPDWPEWTRSQAPPPPTVVTAGGLG